MATSGPDKTGKFQALVDTHSGEKKVAYRSRRIAAKQGDKAVKSIGSTAEANAVFGITSPSEEIEATSPVEVVEATSPSQESEGSSSSLDTESLPSTQEEVPTLETLEPVVAQLSDAEPSTPPLVESPVKVEQPATSMASEDYIEVPESESESESDLDSEHSEVFNSVSEHSSSENSSNEYSSDEYPSSEYSEEEQEQSDSDFDSRFPLAGQGNRANPARKLFADEETGTRSIVGIEPPTFDAPQTSVTTPEVTTYDNPPSSSSSSSSTISSAAPTPVNAPVSSRTPSFVQNAMKALMARPVPLAISFTLGSGLLLTGAALPVAVVAIATTYAGFEVARRVRETVAKRHYDEAVKAGWIDGATNKIVADRFPQLRTLDFVKGSQAETSWKNYALDAVKAPRTFVPFSQASAAYQAGRELRRRELEAANAPAVEASCCKTKLN